MGDVILMCAQSCLPLCDPVDCSLPGSSIHGIFQARVLEWGAISSPVLTLKEAYYHKCRFNFYHFHVFSCNVTGSFQKTQLVLQRASLSQNLNGWGGILFFVFSNLPDWQPTGRDPVGDLEAGGLCPSSCFPCNSAQSWASHLTLIS